MEYIAVDRKQVFGSSQLDKNYMCKIRRIFDEIVSEQTREVMTE